MPVSIRRHTELPGPAVLDAADIPVLDGLDDPPTPSTVFRWQPMERARMYALEVSAPMPVATPLEPYPTLWVLSSWRLQGIELPALPPDCDAASEWLTTTGRYRVWACERWVMPFGRLIRSVAPLDWACGLSDAVTGSIVPAR